MTEADDELAMLAKALGHPARVTILRMLIQKASCVRGELVDGLPLSQTTVWQHLKVLKDAGLVHGEIDGPKVCYCINHAALDRLKTLVGNL